MGNDLVTKADANNFLAALIQLADKVHQGSDPGLVFVNRGLTAGNQVSVHLVYVGEDADDVTLRDGILADIAPTLLDMLDLEKPASMTGKTLIERDS